MSTTALRIGDTVRLKGSSPEGHDRIGKVTGLSAPGWVEIAGQFTRGQVQSFPVRELERVDIASLGEEIESGSVERSIRIPTGSRVEDGKVVIEPTLSYMRNQPLATARMTPHEALLLAQSLIDSAAKALGR